MTNERSQKDILKKDAATLKEDLDSRETVIETREVPITVGIGQSKSEPPKDPPGLGDATADDLRRKELGL